MAQAEPWIKAEVAGPKKALLITKPEVVVALTKRAKRPIIVVGHEAIDIGPKNNPLLKKLISIAEGSKIPLVATAHIVGEFIKKGFQPAAWMPVMDIGNRLKDPDWKGLDDKGPYDVALFVGLSYYVQWLILSGLKHFAPHLTTISLDRFYQPHASWSFGNTKVREWNKNLNVIVDKLGTS
jgi:acetyl-CoA decarbonylase/synthase complex subunit epsilon